MRQAVERIYENDERVLPQTVLHHKARYYMIQKGKGRALDLGCGTGYGTEFMRLQGYKTIGVDCSKEAIKYAKKHYPINTFIVSKIQNFKFEEYDLITFFEVIEHISYRDDIVAIKKCYKALKKGGIFMLSVPRDSNPIYNKFHISQWGYPTILGALSMFFTKVNCLGQDWETGLVSDKNILKNDFYIFICEK